MPELKQVDVEFVEEEKGVIDIGFVDMQTPQISLNALTSTNNFQTISYNRKRVAIRGTHKPNLEWLRSKTSKKVVKQAAQVKFQYMASMVYELLEVVIIKKSDNPFLSPIEIVNNKRQLLENSLEDHMVHLQTILESVRQHKLFAKKSKYVFMPTQVEYLGHVILLRDTLRELKQVDVEFVEEDQGVIDTGFVEMQTPQISLNALTMIDDYEDVFAIPTKLTPYRKHDHRIPSGERVFPVNIRPYRHPPNQKDVIESMVNELLEAGILKKSHSPFTSPIEIVN
ncbi:hypothetical protein Tco_0682316 [Tanacetum coccineum]|uniref:Uncharacterized protein n=1 Tax=Tanacetum coccineum TaxID=301880 RepID=A0ABQ4XRF8_9ASTR